MREQCGVEPQYKCEMCTKAFTRKNQLKLHYIVHHKTIVDLKKNVIT